MRVALLFFLIIPIIGVSQEKLRFSDRTNLGSEVNSPYHEQNPVMSPDGRILYFTRSGDPYNIGGKQDEGDIWYSIRTDSGSWGPAINLGWPLNNEENNSVIGFTPNGSTLYLNCTYTETKKPGISRTIREGSGWGAPSTINVEYFRNNSPDQSVCLSADGKVMVMSINSFGSYGAEDLYVSFKLGPNTWSQPKNLGSVINTRFEDITPSMSADGKLLFFSSNGHGGYGSKDIFVSERLDDSWQNWSKPENLGPGVNSSGMELSFMMIPGTDQAYYVSTQNSDGYGDIYSVRLQSEAPPVPELPDPATISLRGRIFNTASNEPIEAEIVFTTIPEGPEVEKVYSSSSTGAYDVNLTSNRDYLVSIKARGYMRIEEKLTLTASNSAVLPMDYALQPLAVGSTITLENVLFERGRAVLLDSSFQELDLLVQIMQEYPAMKIKLAGHTDNRGSQRLNLILSKERVETVENYLISKGINRKRITGEGYGGAQPKYSNDSEETRRLNRRVEFTVVEN